LRYTRYDYRKKNKELFNLIVVLVGVLIVAFVLGSGIYSLFLKPINNLGENLNIKQTDNVKLDEVDGNSQISNTTNGSNTIKFVVIQSGFFKQKENAEALKRELNNYVNSFVIEDGEGIRIMSGIFSEEDSEKIIQVLNQNGLPNTKVIFNVNKGDLCDAEIAEIINGNIKILTKLMEKEVSAVQTDDYKNWITASIESVDVKSKNYSSFEEYKAYIAGLPKEFGKEKAEENYIYIYNLLKKISLK
jgi:hypothetical protein